MSSPSDSTDTMYIAPVSRIECVSVRYRGSLKKSAVRSTYHMLTRFLLELESSHHVKFVSHRLTEIKSMRGPTQSCVAENDNHARGGFRLHHFMEFNGRVSHG